ncbi:MAG: transcription antitermination protein NusB [Clostridia bacterium]|nr:transcription antitermination protein NusB [Clostridia bacterium]
MYVFSSRFNGWDDDLKRRLYKNQKLTSDDTDYCERVLKNIMEHEADMDAVIDRVSEGFPGANIFPADKSILYIAAAEILYLDDIPPEVSISEAANLANKYSSAKSADFVSGVLSGVLKENV